MRFLLPKPEDTETMGAKIWLELPEQCLIFLHGQLGAGKTTLVRGILRGAGYDGVVKSPTYTLVEEYSVANQKICHFDLYRVKDPEELEWIGIRDYLEQGCICLIEWPEMGRGFLPDPDIEFTLSLEGHGRSLDIDICSPEFKKI